MKCDCCNDRIFVCAECGKEFEVDDDFICTTGGKHYCNIGCFLEHLNRIYEETEVVR